MSAFKGFTKLQGISAYIVPETLVIEQAITYLEKTRTRTLFVVNKDKELVGSLSDSDLRLYASSGGDMTLKLVACMNVKPLFLKEKEAVSLNTLPPDLSSTLAFPIVNDQSRIVSLYEKDETASNGLKKVHLFVLAGGRGLRMMPYTQHCPKPMLKVNGKPMLEHILSSAYKQGIREATISLGYKGNVIRDHFGNGEDSGLNLHYVEDKKPLGTAGPLSLLKDVSCKNLIIINGDVLTSCDFQSLLNFHARWSADATICVKNVQQIYPYGVVKSESGTMTGFEEKPSLSYQINTGIYVLKRELLDEIEPNKYLDMPDALMGMANKGQRVKVFAIYENWQDIGTPLDFEKINTQQNSWLG